MGSCCQTNCLLHLHHLEVGHEVDLLEDRQDLLGHPCLEVVLLVDPDQVDHLDLLDRLDGLGVDLSFLEVDLLQVDRACLEVDLIPVVPVQEGLCWVVVLSVPSTGFFESCSLLLGLPPAPRLLLCLLKY